MDGFIAIIRYTLRYDPYDGSAYVFRDRPGSMLKYIEWDGQSFWQGKRRAQSGTYPWPPGEPGSVTETNEREFEYLLSGPLCRSRRKNSRWNNGENVAFSLLFLYDYPMKTDEKCAAEGQALLDAVEQISLLYETESLEYKNVPESKLKQVT